MYNLSSIRASLGVVPAGFLLFSSLSLRLRIFFFPRLTVSFLSFHLLSPPFTLLLSDDVPFMIFFVCYDIYTMPGGRMMMLLSLLTLERMTTHEALL